MASPVGRLIVEFAASTAKFQEDLGKAVRIAEQNSKRIQKAFDGIKAGIAGIASGLIAGLSATAFIGMIRNTIDAQDRLNDLSKSTGVAVETLGGLGFAAKQSGSSLEGVGKSIGKLNLQIAAALGGNEEAVQTFKDLGISLNELKNSSPNEVFAKIADSFSVTEDGAIKAAYGNKIFGKAYQEIIPLLDEGGAKLLKNVEYFRRFGGVTAESAKAADDFNDAMVKLHLLQGRFGAALVRELLPAMQTLADSFIENKEKSTLFDTAATNLASTLKLLAIIAVNIHYTFNAVGTEIGGIAAQMNALARLDFKGFKFIGDEMKRDAEEARRQIDKFNDAINNPKAVFRVPSTDPYEVDQAAAKRKLPTPRASGGGSGAADDPTRKILEGRLKAIEATLAKEVAILKAHGELLEAANGAGLVSLSDYYGRKEELRQSDIGLQRKAFADEAKLLQARVDDPKLKATEREDARNKLIDLNKKLELSEIAASTKGLLGWYAQNKAINEFKDNVEELGIRLAELNKVPNAAAARFDFSNRGVNAEIALNKQSPDEDVRRAAEIGERVNAGLREREIQQGQLNSKTEDYGFILDKLSLVHERIDIAVSSGQIGELEGLDRLSKANEAYIVVLQKELALLQAVAEKSTGADRDAAIINVDRLRVQLERLNTQTDLVGDKFRKIFKDSFADSLADAVDGTKTLSQAFNSMANDISRSITRLASQRLTDAIFGKAGDGGSDIFSLLAKYFVGGAAGGAATTAAPPILGYFASGTNFAPGGIAMVGESGPEKVILPRGSQVVPNNSMGGNVIRINVNVPAGTTRATSMQIARDVGSATSRAMRSIG